MFLEAFGVGGVVAGALAWHNSRPKAQAVDAAAVAAPPGFAQFQRSFLVCILLAYFSDWLQGAYIYDLYSSYGYDQV
jgi:Sugar-tranasporters, 12 TM